MSNPSGVLRPQYHNMGDGYVQFGPPNTLYNDAAASGWADLGAVSGKSVLKITPKTVDSLGGSPEDLLEEQVASVEVTAEITLKEMTMQNLIYKMGIGGTKTYTQGSMVTVTNEAKLIETRTWYHLNQTNLTVGPVTASIAGATPVSLVENVDIQINRTFGLIRAIKGGALDTAIGIAVASTGVGVYITTNYTFTAPDANVYSYTPDNRKPWYAARFVGAQDNTHRLVALMYRTFLGAPDALDFEAGKFHEFKIMARCAIDFTRDPSDNKFKLIEEIIPNNVVG